jgi:hypothetical protein
MVVIYTSLRAWIRCFAQAPATAPRKEIRHYQIARVYDLARNYPYDTFDTQAARLATRASSSTIVLPTYLILQRNNLANRRRKQTKNHLPH